LVNLQVIFFGGMGEFNFRSTPIAIIHHETSNYCLLAHPMNPFDSIYHIEGPNKDWDE